MDTIEAILTRRSVRKFQSTPIKPELFTQLLQAGMNAPSGNNEQPWHFIIVDKREILDAIPKIQPNAKMCYEAPAAIVVCGDLKLEQYKGYCVLNLAAATQNILLAARALELGAVWLGIYPQPERIIDFRKLFNLPEIILPFAAVAIGYSDVLQTKVDRFNKERIHTNQW